jgi:3-oxoacyl-[acyl-carrier protein] reductase/bacilysin biosynthesis oxidoreductase BacG
MNLGLRGRTAIVTGGSQGLGKAVALALAGEGVRVVTCARGEALLREAAREIRDATGSEVLPVVADMGRSDDVHRLVQTTVETFGCVDILVNGASNFRSGTLMDLTDEDWLNAFNIKFLGYVRTSREAVPHMRAGGWGRIVNLAGGAARQAEIPGLSSGAINIALTNLTKKLSDEVAQFGITVNAIHPGMARTQRREDAYRRAMQQRGITRAEAEQAAVERIPIGRLIEPDEVAAAVLYFASNQAAAVTGQVLAVDGGMARGIYI